jgi:hypothetical protein
VGTFLGDEKTLATATASQDRLVDLLEDVRQKPLGELPAAKPVDAIVRRILAEPDKETLDVAAFQSSI